MLIISLNLILLETAAAVGVGEAAWPSQNCHSQQIVDGCR